MGFTKTQSVESAEVLSPVEHRKLEDNLHRLGKTSAKDLTEDERRQALKKS